MNRPSAWEREAARVTREVARRAAWRLDILEWLILSLAGGLAIGGGALVAWLIAGPSGAGFRTVWLVASLILFVVPGAVALARWKREERKRSEAMEARREGNDG